MLRSGGLRSPTMVVSAHLLAFTSYAEIILAQQSSDHRHPVFNKMFIESEYLPEQKCLLFHRRPAREEEQPVYLVHFFTSNQEKAKLTGYETDRKLFLGRGRTTNARLYLPSEMRLRCFRGQPEQPWIPSAHCRPKWHWPPMRLSSWHSSPSRLGRGARRSSLLIATGAGHRSAGRLADARRKSAKELIQLSITSAGDGTLPETPFSSSLSISGAAR